MSKKPTTAETMHEVMEGMSQVLEGINGYRQQCLAAGYSETAAERMAMDFHQSFVAAMFRAQHPS